MMIMKRIKTDCTGITESGRQHDEKVVTTYMEVKSEEVVTKNQKGKKSCDDQSRYKIAFSRK